MNKFLYIFLFAAFSAFSQPNAEVVTDTVLYDTTAVTVRDTMAIRPKPVHFRNGFRSRYKGRDFSYTVKSIEKSWWEKFKEKLANFLNRLFSIQTGKGTQTTMGIMLKVFVGLSLLAVIYLLVRAMVSKEGKWIFGRNSDRNILRYEEMTADIQRADFEKLIEEARHSGDRRLAIRFYYLWLLKAMTQQNQIEWDIEKTNSDYMREIVDERLRERFSYLSYLYNNVWYGAFEVNDDIYDKTARAFGTTIKSLKP